MSSNTITAPPIQHQLRWDRAYSISYYQFTGLHLAPILTSIDNYLACYEQLQLPDCTSLIDNIFTSIVNVLTNGVKQFVPHCPKNVFKFWLDEESDLLKDASADSNRVWKAAGKPKSGPIFDKRQSCQLIYRKRIRERQIQTLSSFENDLHEALLHKIGPAFWKVWRSKFNKKSKPIEVDCCTDTKMIVNKFAHCFADSSLANNVTRASELTYMMSLNV